MSDDLIKRSDAIKVTWQEPTYTDPLNVLTEVRDRIEAIPSADRPQGEWINYKDEHYCTNCGEVVIGDWYDTNDWYDYCPWCGAKMKGADDDSDNV